MEEDEAQRRRGGRRPSWRRSPGQWMFFTGLLFLWILFLLQQPLVHAVKTDVSADQWNEFLKPFRDRGEKPTYSQIQQWVEQHGQGSGNLSITPDLYPRLFPFCVTHEQIMNPILVSQAQDSKLFQFQHIFKRIETFHNVFDKFYNFKEEMHSVAKNQTFIESVKLSRINPPELDMINLRQWAHITIKSKIPLQGIYVQSLVGPIGLPLGDFNLDFGCLDLQGSDDMLTLGELYHCHYRPRANIYHPRVFVGYKPKGPFKNEWHVHFQWTDITCMETPYLQFLIIAVKENGLGNPNPEYGHDYAIVYSPVFVNTAFDTKDAYPYHPLWKDRMLCGATSTDYINGFLPDGGKLPLQAKVNGDSAFDDLKWTVSTDIFRIQPNEEYDACVRGTTRQDILQAKDLIRLECPPGPFRCNSSYQQTASSSNNDTLVTIQRQQLVSKENETSHCYPCAAPACLELQFSKRQCEGTKTEIIHHNDTGIIENFETVARSKSHGMLAILATMVFLPIANFMGRHYKEVCRNCLCGNGPWIFVHVIFHFISAIILWLSVGPVVASVSDYDEVLVECSSIYNKTTEQETCASDKSIRNPHVPTGIVVFVFQNLLIIFGFFRSSKNKIRLAQLIAHSHLGYFTFVMAAISALLAVYNNECLENVILIVFLFIVPIVLHIISCVLDCMTDKKVGVSPGRRQYPILEPIRLEKRGPCEPCKWCAFFVLVLSMMALWFMVVLSANFASKKDPEKFDPNVPVGSVSSAYSGPDAVFQGVFGVCGKVAGKQHYQ